jgi:hypothetical protein
VRAKLRRLKGPSQIWLQLGDDRGAQVRCSVLVINGRNDDNSPIPVIEAYAAKLRSVERTLNFTSPTTPARLLF